MRTSESVSEPASSHWSLWNVTVRIGQEEEPVEHRLDEHALAQLGAGRGGQRVARHAISSTSAASSSTRTRRESRSSSRFASSTEASPPFANRPCRSTSAARIPSTSSGATTTPELGLADEVRGSAVGRHDRQDRPAGCDVLVDLPGEDAFSAAARVGHEEEQRLRVALESQRIGPRRVRDELEAVAELERLGPLAVGRAEVADEAGDRVEVRLLERLEKRPRIALAEEAPGVRDPEPAARHVLEPREVVEVAAVRDHADGALRTEPAHLVRDRLRHARDRVRSPRDELRDLLDGGLAGTRGGRVVATVLVGDERVAQVGDPACARRALHGRADEVHRRRWRRRDHGVDSLTARRCGSRRGSR